MGGSDSGSSASGSASGSGQSPPCALESSEGMGEDGYSNKSMDVAGRDADNVCAVCMEV